jgi:hypothetical protein
MDDLKSFEEELTALIGNPTDLRPFVCDGSPLQCQAFLVGINPATSMSVNFWQFWRPGYGFDKQAWFEAYKIDRKSRPLKPGKKRRNAISNTRRVIELILEEAHPIRCLETNIYSAPTEQAADLASAQRVTAPFDFLLEKIKPGVIVAHGDDAAQHLRGKTLTSKLITERHFSSRSPPWKKEDARALGQRIKTECSRAQPIASADEGSG